MMQIATTLRKNKATLLIIDGVTTIGDLDEPTLAFRKFTHELNAFVGNSNCTAFLLSSMETSGANPEHTMVDGIIQLHHQKVGVRSLRQIEVRKFRGSSHLQGEHLFKITDEGIKAYPRLEALGVVPQVRGELGKRHSFDLPPLDEMLGGGLISNSITTIIGPTGTGKTILGLQFLRAGVEAGEACVFFGFYEPPDVLLEKALHLGFPIENWVKKGLLAFHWVSALEEELDVIGDSLLQAIERTGAKRVVIDALDGFRNSTSQEKRVNLFLTALVMRVKAMGATLIIIEGTSILLNPAERKVNEMSALNENLIYLRHIEMKSKLTRVISILKIRSAIYDPAIRELSISNKGINILGAVQRVEDHFLGAYRHTQKSTSKPVKTTSKKRKK